MWDHFLGFDSIFKSADQREADTLDSQIHPLKCLYPLYLQHFPNKPKASVSAHYIIIFCFVKYTKPQFHFKA